MTLTRSRLLVPEDHLIDPDGRWVDASLSGSTLTLEFTVPLFFDSSLVSSWSETLLASKVDTDMKTWLGETTGGYLDNIWFVKSAGGTTSIKLSSGTVGLDSRTSYTIPSADLHDHSHTGHSTDHSPDVTGVDVYFEDAVHVKPSGAPAGKDKKYFVVRGSAAPCVATFSMALDTMPGTGDKVEIRYEGTPIVNEWSTSDPDVATYTWTTTVHPTVNLIRSGAL